MLNILYSGGGKIWIFWIKELQQIDRWFIWIDINKDEKYLERMIFGNTYRNIFYNIDDFELVIEDTIVLYLKIFPI